MGYSSASGMEAGKPTVGSEAQPTLWTTFPVELKQMLAVRISETTAEHMNAPAGNLVKRVGSSVVEAAGCKPLSGRSPAGLGWRPGTGSAQLTSWQTDSLSLQSK